MNLEDRYKRVAKCLVEDMHGDLLVFNPENVVTVHLNGSSSLVWRLCDGAGTVSEIIQALQATYPSQASQISDDVIRVIDDLKQNQVIEKVT